MFSRVRVATTLQDYATHFEPSKPLDWAKTRNAWEKTPDHPEAEFGLSHMWNNEARTHGPEGGGWLRAPETALLNNGQRDGNGGVNLICMYFHVSSLSFLQLEGCDDGYVTSSTASLVVCILS